jgi:predicted metal-dependent HD superfamily phosphohydrolase
MTLQTFESLQQRWLCLLANSGDADYLAELFNDIVDHYNESHRAYHTLEHIAACLMHLDQIVNHLDQPLEVELAIWLHDVIYDPKRSDNEEQSAIYASDKLSRTTLAPAQIQRVAQLIRLTQHPATPRDNDERYLLDIDLSILGAPADIFDTYEQHIRREYAHVPQFFYRRGRKKILTLFTNTNPLFTTGYFNDLLEARARSNLQRALVRL